MSNDISTRTGRVSFRARARGFTLVEMLVATFVLVLILGMTLQIINYANTLFLSSRKRIDTFQEARAGFETMTRRISQAMLDTYWDYASGPVGSGTGAPRPAPSGNTVNSTWLPTQYLRTSQLHFVCGPMQAATVTGTAGAIVPVNTASTNNPFVKMVGDGIFFQAPIGYSDISANAGMPNLLNACGYFLEFSSDNPDRPLFLTGTESGVTPPSGGDALPVKFRFRLKEFNLPAEDNYVYSYVTGTANAANTNSWFSYPLIKKIPSGAQGTLPFSPQYTLAQNVIALIIEPMRSPNYPSPSAATVELAPYYVYDSRLWANATAASSPLAIASRNQLPPQVLVTMVAIDEASAARLQALYGGASPGAQLPVTANGGCFSDSGFATNSALPNGLYTSAGRYAQSPVNGAVTIFSQASNPSESATAASSPSGYYISADLNNQYQVELADLEQALVNLKITYRVFTTNVTILQAKFSD